MADKTTQGGRVVVHGATAEDVVLTRVLDEQYAGVRVPLKVVTGVQHTSDLSFELKPGAIVAHTGSTVIFVCG
jgi:hypothetical protein